jgi:hypothetical protein
VTVHERSVTFEAEDAVELLAVVNELVRRDPDWDSERLRRIRTELDRVSARTSVVSVPSTSVDGTWLTPQQMSERYGKSDRTWRRRAKAGVVEAVWEDGRWWIKP